MTPQRSGIRGVLRFFLLDAVHEQGKLFDRQVLLFQVSHSDSVKPEAFHGEIV